MDDQLDETQSTEVEVSSVNKPNPYSKQSSYVLDDQIYVDVWWEPENDEVTFKVEMPSDSYLAFAFGKYLDNCDMLVFEAHQDDP